MGFYLALSSVAYFSVFSFCLTYCVWGLHLAGCRFVNPVVFGVFPQWVRLVQWLVEGTGACVLVGGAGSFLSGGQGHVRWGVLWCL